MFLELHKGHHEGFLEELTNNSARSGTNETPEQKYRRIFGAGKIMTEPIFYSGSGAYDFQYLDFAVVKYRDDEAWISQHMGIAIPEMATIARELKRLHEQKYNALRTLPRGNFSVLCKAAQAVFCFKEKDLQHFGAAAVKDRNATQTAREKHPGIMASVIVQTLKVTKTKAATEFIGPVSRQIVQKEDDVSKPRIPSGLRLIDQVLKFFIFPLRAQLVRSSRPRNRTALDRKICVNSCRSRALHRCSKTNSWRSQRWLNINRGLTCGSLSGALRQVTG